MRTRLIVWFAMVLTAAVLMAYLDSRPAHALDPHFEDMVRKLDRLPPCGQLAALGPHLARATEADRQAVATMGPGKFAMHMYREGLKDPQRTNTLRAIEVASGIQNTLRAPATAWLSRKPTDPAKTVAAAELILKDMACPGVDVAAQADALRIGIHRHKAYLEEEARCAADPKCQAQRIADSLCEYQQQRSGILKDIREQRSYARRAGVIAVRRLAELRDP